MGRIKQGRRTKLSSETEDLLRWAIKEQYADKLMSDLLDAGYTADDALKIAADLSIDKRIEKHIETRIEDLCIKDFASAVGPAWAWPAKKKTTPHILGTRNEARVGGCAAACSNHASGKTPPAAPGGRRTRHLGSRVVGFS